MGFGRTWRFYWISGRGRARAPDDRVFSTWTERLRDWLRLRGSIR
jgi:hypothetical protein